jgi:hypothetical protein
VAGSPLPWTGDFLDGLGNKMSLAAYANPPDVTDEKQRADGYGVVRFNKKERTITFECWPRFAAAKDGDRQQFPGWPITVKMDDNDGRKPVAWLPELRFAGGRNAVVQVIAEATGEILYTVRVRGARYQPAVFAPGTYTVKIGRNKPDAHTLASVTASTQANAGTREVKI